MLNIKYHWKNFEILKTKSFLIDNFCVHWNKDSNTTMTTWSDTVSITMEYKWPLWI